MPAAIFLPSAIAQTMSKILLTISLLEVLRQLAPHLLAP
jgi:hypothetical protein